MRKRNIWSHFNPRIQIEVGDNCTLHVSIILCFVFIIMKIKMMALNGK